MPPSTVKRVTLTCAKEPPEAFIAVCPARPVGSKLGATKTDGIDVPVQTETLVRQEAGEIQPAKVRPR